MLTGERWIYAEIAQSIVTLGLGFMRCLISSCER
jgi:hypothetical protein